MNTFNNLYNRLLNEDDADLNRYVYDGGDELKIYSRVFKYYIERSKQLKIRYEEDWPDGPNEESTKWWEIDFIGDNLFTLWPSKLNEIKVDFEPGGGDSVIAYSQFFQQWVEDGVTDCTIHLKTSKFHQEDFDSYYLITPKGGIKIHPMTVKLYGV